MSALNKPVGFMVAAHELKPEVGFNTTLGVFDGV